MQKSEWALNTGWRGTVLDDIVYSSVEDWIVFAINRRSGCS